MVYKCIAIMAITIIYICSVSSAGILFEDNFNDDSNWVNASNSPFTAAAQNGHLTVTASIGNDAYLKHVLPEDKQVSDFTYSVKFSLLSPNTNGNGILFCWQNDFQGYAFFITANKEYIFGKWIKTSATTSDFKTIEGFYFTHIYEKDNLLKISKKGNDFYLYCNNIFISKVSDTQFSKGSIGLYVGKSEKINFDHATLKDHSETNNPSTYFSDTFDKTNLDGWRKLNGSGTVSANSGNLQIKDIDTTIRFYTNNNFKNAPCTTIVTYKGGSKDAYYGMNFMLIKPNATSYPTYSFIINANKNFAATQTSSFTPKAHQKINGTTDTLIITAQYHFIINGEVVDNKSIKDEGIEFNALGLMVQPNIAVDVAIFKAGIKSTPIIVQKNTLPVLNQPSYFLGGMGIIYDPKGRKVATFQNRYQDKLKDLSAGPYIIIFKNNKDFLIRRAIVNSK